MYAPAESHSLEQLISQQATLLGELKALLEQEHRALSDQDADELNSVSIAKRDLARSIDILEHKRLARADAQSSQTSQSWHQMVELARECERLNQVNGLIVHSNQRRIRQALGLLRANISAGETYSADGSTTLDSTSRSLAQV
ncbi:MAG: hypothetical protein AMJ69_09220 [Gammaproteobacteria bacterium SG8_47]|nr:MAG: hypothetical protein AMJ69_09220 [Gammaproteobacteria bacterium SG8_47]